MKLKEYIEILKTFDQEAEVLKKIHPHHRSKFLVELKKEDIHEPWFHFKYNEDTGISSLVNSFVV